MKLKGLHFADVAEIQEAVTDELKRVQKEEFSAAAQKLYGRAKAYLYANGAYFEFFKKKVCVFLAFLRLKKNICPEKFGPHCIHTFQVRIQNFSLGGGLYVRLYTIYV